MTTVSRSHTLNLSQTDLTSRTTNVILFKEWCVPGASEVSVELRLQQLRAGKRVNSRVPIEIEWSESGHVYSSRGWTIDIGPKGCMAVAPQGFPIGQRLKLVNLVNKNSSEAILVWRGHEGHTGWELGLELQDPGPDFWGLDF